MQLNDKEFLILKYFLEQEYLSVNFFYESIFKYFYDKTHLYRKIKKFREKGLLKIAKYKPPELYKATKLLMPTKKAKNLLIELEQEDIIKGYLKQYPYLKHIKPNNYIVNRKSKGIGYIRRRLIISDIRFKFERSGCKNFISKATDHKLFDFLDSPDFLISKHDRPDMSFPFYLMIDSKYKLNDVFKKYLSIRNKDTQLSFFILNDELYHKAVNRSLKELDYDKELTAFLFMNYNDIKNNNFDFYFVKDNTMLDGNLNLKIFGQNLEDFLEEEKNNGYYLRGF